MIEFLSTIIYVLPLALMVGLYGEHRRRMHRRNVATRDANIEAGLTEPASLHPVIDPVKCIGCKACIKACPEMPHHAVIGLIYGKAELISPTECIGHGACLTACPEGAITLVFGTEKRGVDIPNVGPDFQTNVPGVYIAGELGGMGLIRNAIEQGRQAVAQIAEQPRASGSDEFDVVIIGAGPAGFSSSLACMEKGLRYLTLEQDTFGGTVAHYPRGKLVMTAPAHLPLYGKMNMGEISKEDLMSFWEGVRKKTGVQIQFGQRVTAIKPETAGFTIETETAKHRTRHVLLAIGRRGTPRKLEVKGEELNKVTYRLIEPEQYVGKKVLIVGGGDSAIEAATSIAAERDTDVTLSYRSEAFSRVKPGNRTRVEAAVEKGRIRLMLKSQVLGIGEDHVQIKLPNEEVSLPNDAVIVSAGGILPTAFLKAVGIRFETKFGKA